MAATDMKKAGLEAGCKVNLPHGRHGIAVRKADNGLWIIRSLGSEALYGASGIERDYDDAQAARHARFERLSVHYPGDAGVPECSDTIERYVLVQYSEEEVLVTTERGTVPEKRRVYCFVRWADTFEDVVDFAGGDILDGTFPEAVFDLDTGDRIEVHVSSPVITKSEDQGAMVNVLSDTEIEGLRAELRQLEDQASVSTRDARRIEWIEDMLSLCDHKPAMEGSR